MFDKKKKVKEPVKEEPKEKPKEEKGRYNHLGLFELTELVNKAGYDFC